MNRSFNFSFSQFPLIVVLVFQSEDQKSITLQYRHLGRFIEVKQSISLSKEVFKFLTILSLFDEFF